MSSDLKHVMHVMQVTMLLVVNNALQGILSSFFFKYTDTILKKYSSTMATIFTGLMSALLFGHALTINFCIGVTIVFISMHIFFSQGGLLLYCTSAALLLHGIKKVKANKQQISRNSSPCWSQICSQSTADACSSALLQLHPMHSCLPGKVLFLPILSQVTLAPCCNGSAFGLLCRSTAGSDCKPCMICCSQAAGQYFHKRSALHHRFCILHLSCMTFFAFTHHLLSFVRSRLSYPVEVVSAMH